MVNFCAVCGCCTQTDIVREHLEDTLRICDVSAMGRYMKKFLNSDSLRPIRIEKFFHVRILLNLHLINKHIIVITSIVIIIIIRLSTL